MENYKLNLILVWWLVVIYQAGASFVCGMLDNLSEMEKSNVGAAYALRRLTCDYDGPLITVVSSDFGEANVTAESPNKLVMYDGTLLETWSQDRNLSVKIWFDQIGTRHLAVEKEVFIVQDHYSGDWKLHTGTGGIGRYLYLNFSPTERSDFVDTIPWTLWVQAEPTYPMEIVSPTTSGIMNLGNRQFLLSPEYGPYYTGDINAVGVGLELGTNGICVPEHGDSRLGCLLVYQGQFQKSCNIVVTMDSDKSIDLYVDGTHITEVSKVVSAADGTNLIVVDVAGTQASYGYFRGYIEGIVWWKTQLPEVTISQLSLNSSLFLPSHSPSVIPSITPVTASPTNSPPSAYSASPSSTYSASSSSIYSASSSSTYSASPSSSYSMSLARTSGTASSSATNSVSVSSNPHICRNMSSNNQDKDKEAMFPKRMLYSRTMATAPHQPNKTSSIVRLQ